MYAHSKEISPTYEAGNSQGVYCVLSQARPNEIWLIFVLKQIHLEN